jgi:hypothetical protein
MHMQFSLNSIANIIKPKFASLIMINRKNNEVILSLYNKLNFYVKLRVDSY